MTSTDTNLLQKVLAARGLLKKNLMINNFPLHGFEIQKRQVYSSIKRTVLRAESDSLVVVGPRGCGKSALIRSCLHDLENKYALVNDYIFVQLNGLIHTDDNLALKEIIRQLHVDVLSGDRIFGSFSDNLFFVLQSLKSCKRDISKGIIIILDEFHLFCSHRNQTLLYNLFDVAQSAQAPICVIGLTTRIDITEMLEKRVKSRFSHRQVMLYPNFEISDRLLLIIDYLSLPEEGKLIIKPLDKHFTRLWNDNVLKIFKTKNIILKVKRELELDPSESKLKSWLFLVISRISEENPFITEQIIEGSIGNGKDEKIDLLMDLSALELCLVIAMCHHNEIFDGEPFNFLMIFKRYSKFTANNNGLQTTQKIIVLKEFERLAEIELIMPIINGNQAFKKEYQLYNLCVTKSQVQEAVNNYIGLPTDIAQWASSSLFCL